MSLRKTSDGGLPPRDGASPGLLTIDHLAERWGISVDKVCRRLRSDASPKAVNMGTTKYPELRFRIEAIIDWESQMEQPASVFIGAITLGGEQRKVEGQGGAVKATPDQTPADLLDFKPRKRKASS